MKTTVHAVVLTLTSIVAFADVPDYTASLEYVACPSAKRWTERQRMPVCDLFFHDGKLWVGGGATELNAGPCPLQYIDPVTKQVVVERNAGTENITVFKRFSDGRLYVPSQDPRDYDADYDDDGYLFVRNGENDWTFYKGCAQQQQIDSVSKNTKMGGFTHVWDAEEYAGNIFIGGYGISRTTDFGATWKCATPSWKYGKMALHNVNGVYDFTKKVYKTPTGVTDSKPADGYGTYRRELQFMKFKDRLFAIPYQYVPSDVPTKYYDAAIELHRYDEATGSFYEMTNRTSRVFPGLSDGDFNMSLLKERMKFIPSMHTLKLWHTTPFMDRVFYVVSPYDTYTNCWGSARKGYGETQYPYPMFACAADPTDDGMFTSERLDFGHAEEYPFDFLVKGDRMYALTVRYDSADKLVRHSVWVTTDAHSFTRLFTFKFHQYLISMEYANGYFYFGAGYKGASQSTYQLNTTGDCAGNVYRIAAPQNGEIQIEVETASVSIAEGGSGTARFRLKSAPPKTIVADVIVSGQVTTSVKTLTFTTSNWSDWQSVPFSVEQDETYEVVTAAIACNAAGLVSAAEKVTPVNDDFAEVETKPEGLVDLTSPEGSFTCPDGCVTALPFNDSTNKGDAGNRFCYKSKTADIVYDFGFDVVINAYCIFNLACNTETTRPPAEWKFYGSVDGVDWTLLDYRRWEYNWKSGEDRYHTCDNKSAYRYYKFSVLNNNGDSYTQFQKLEYYGYVKSAETEAVEPVDMTDQLVYLCNPAKSRWSGSAQSRHVQDLHPYQGKIYTSGGEWGGNTGPCPCFAVDPYSGAYENEFDAGTDAIYEFKTFTDGLVYCSAIDIHEGAAHAGHTFRKEADGNWKAYSNCNRGNQSDIKDQGGYYIHNWDMAEYQGKVFVCGYGISGSDTYCTTKMFDATPTLKNSSRKVDGRTWTDPSGGRYNAQYGYSFYRRFTAFLPFDEDLFCIPNQPIMYKDVFTWNEWEPWRWDETANQFVCTTNTWADICPDAVESMANFEDFASGTAMVQLWHSTKFKNRVLYILGGHDYNITPWAAYSAVDVDHKIKATRIDLGSVDIRPFDIYPTEDAVYLVAAEASKTTTTVTNSIWKSTDGVSFTKLLWFTSTRQASALCYYDGSFYVGMGSNTDILKGWPKVTGADVSGNIYRIPYGEQSIRFECENGKLSVVEGGSGTARFRLTEKPSANVTAKITASGAVSTSVKTLTFTTSNWNAWQSVAFLVGQDEVTADQKGALVCGGVDGIVGGTCMITILNDDFAEKEVAPEGLVDLTTPDGKFTHDATTGVVTMKPFNNAATDNDTNNRVCVQQKHFSIVYEFPSNAMVNAYSIKAMTINSYAERAPSEWKFYASDDKASWTELDHRRWEIGWKSGELRYHTCANTKYYKYYKIEFLGNNGNEYIQFARLEYYGEFEQSGDQPAFVKGTPIFYEGFATADYSTLETGKRAGLNNGPNARTSSIGMAEGKWNSMGSNQPSWYSPDKGLALPAAMSAVGFTATGTSVGMNPESQYAQARGAYHALADGLLASSSTGRFVFRVLLNADATALNALTGADTIVESSGSDSPGVNYYGAGFVKKPSGTNYGIITSQPNALAFFLKKMKDGSFRAVCRAKGTDGTVAGRDLGAITAGKTYIFYAEVTLRANGDIIRAGYQDVAAYSENLPWQGTMTNEVFSASDYPDCVAIGGGYGTKGGYFRADEFAIGTKLNDVLFAEGVGNVEPTEVDAPVIGASGRGIALSEDGKTFGVSIKNAKAGLYYTAYVTDDLAKPFVASDVSIRATTDGALMLEVPTSDRPSLFVKIVVSATPVL